MSLQKESVERARVQHKVCMIMQNLFWQGYGYEHHERHSSSEKWEALLDIRLLGTTCWYGLSNHQAAAAQMGTWQAEFSLGIDKHRRVPTPLGARLLSSRIGVMWTLCLAFCRSRHS